MTTPMHGRKKFADIKIDPVSMQPGTCGVERSRVGTGLVLLLVFAVLTSVCMNGITFN